MIADQEMTWPQAEKAVAEAMFRFSNDPYGWVLWAFPWGVPGGGLDYEDGPDEWQRLELQHIGDGLEDDPHEIIRRAVASGHGIGKSTLVAWLVLWAVTTYPNTRGVVTANTDGQLKTKTWAEVSKWYHMLNPVLKAQFTYTATAIYSTRKDREKNWRIDAVPWSAANPAAFAGLHNAGRRILVVFDEASEIDDVIWDTTEGATTDANTQIIWLAYGNPTRNTGRFRDLFLGKRRSMWAHKAINSMTVKRTNKKLLQSWIDAYGWDNDFVRVRVRGVFPRLGTMQFISSDLVMKARKRDPSYISSDPLVAGLDVARYGEDRSVLQPRRGRDAKSIPPIVWTSIDTMQLAGEVAVWCAANKPDALFVDVGGLGVGVYDRLMQLKVPNVFPVNFGSEGGEIEFNSVPNIRTANKRAQMYGTLRGWMEYGAIPDDDDLESDLTGMQYTFDSDNAILLEKKEHMKARGLASPDWGDALALTFAMPVPPKHTAKMDPMTGRLVPLSDNESRSGVTTDYDPYANLSGSNPCVAAAHPNPLIPLPRARRPRPPAMASCRRGSLTRTAVAWASARRCSRPPTWAPPRRRPRAKPSWDRKHGRPGSLLRAA